MSVPTGTVLDRILAETREEVARRIASTPLSAVDAPAAPAPRRFRAALEAPGIGVIAEFKRRSPSAGALREEPDIDEIVRAYGRGGAVALSILTEGPNFGGSLADLQRARATSALPVLRKDFIVDPYQLHEARAAAADAVLLIAAALEPRELTALHAEAQALGLDVLVEVHDEREVEAALQAGAAIVGVNNRDLRDFSVDVARTERLRASIPAEVLLVSESGIGSAEQLARLQDLDVAAVLVGETLMRAPDPAAALVRLRTFSGAGGAL
ncbi:MAG TPA: indole-3-glycerol phosphate synthase TrpC [Solirubrobacteraceae bacterium]|nr:indole-3-glycerol phosphate synthase TrpC [Solirubrobacteraceae bacterium]